MRTIGVDVGGTSIRAGVVDERGSLLDTARVSTPSEEGALEDAIAGVVEDLRNRHEVAGVGLAVAGFVARDRRSVMFAPHLAWRGAPVADRIEKRVGLPVLLEHDVNSAIVGEHRFGAARGAPGGGAGRAGHRDRRGAAAGRQAVTAARTASRPSWAT